MAVVAQDSPAEKPSAPYIETGNAPLTITRTFEYPKPPDSAKPAIKLPPGVGQPEIIKTITDIHGPVQRVLTYRRDIPNPTEFWLADGTLIGPHPREPSEVQIAGEAADENVGDLRARFSDASWVSVKNFSKWETIQVDKCRVHTASLPHPSNTNNLNPVSGDVTAWIAESTRRPVKIVTKEKTILFAYSAGPAEPVILPQKYANFLKMLKLGATGRAR